jgi:hypothetical protein
MFPRIVRHRGAALLSAAALAAVLTGVGLPGQAGAGTLGLPSGLPDPTTAGVITGSSLLPVSGDVSLSTSGVTFANRMVSGNLYITGNNVTVDNVAVSGSVFVNETPGGSYLSPVPADITLHDVSATSVFTLGFNGLTLDTVNLSYPQNAPQAQIYCYYDANSGVMYPASNLTIKNSWFHGFQPSTTSAHLENLHLACVHGATITNNRFDLFSPDGNNTLSHFTANVTLDARQFGDWNQNVTLSGNTFNGGSYYQLYFCSAGTSNAVTRNQFSSGGDPIFTGVQFPPAAYSPDSLPGGVYPRFTDSGKTLNGSPTALPGGQH